MMVTHKIILYIGMERLKDEGGEPVNRQSALVSHKEIKEIFGSIFEDNGIHAVILFDPEHQNISITRNTTSLQGGG